MNHLPGIPEEQAVESFSRITELKHEHARVIVEEFLRQFREIRIQGALDSLMLEWGTAQPLRIDQFVDMRGNTNIEWAQEEFVWLSLTRQIDSGREDSNTAFCVSMFFAESEDAVPSNSIEIHFEDDFERQLASALSTAYLQSLLDSKPTIANVFATQTG